MNEDGFVYCIDSPVAKDDFNKPFLVFAGWIASIDKISNIALESRNGNFSSPLHELIRKDVEAVHVGKFCVGFREMMSISEIDPNMEYMITFNVNKDKKKIPIVFDADFSRELVKFSKHKKNKLEKIRKILICPNCKSVEINCNNAEVKCVKCNSVFSCSESNFNFLSSDIREYGQVKKTDNISSHNYDKNALSIIDEYKDGIILDNGCGLRNKYFENVVNYEIVEYPSTDVAGIGEKMPFMDNAFDAVFCLNVLEHVTNPFEVADEIVRVLKPGGRLYVVAPFLQPVHGYPNHFYNMTKQGLRNLFDKKISIEESGVSRSGNPIWTLNWILRSYAKGLAEKDRQEFLDSKISEFVFDKIPGDPGVEIMNKNFVKNLKAETIDELACTTYILGRK